MEIIYQPFNKNLYYIIINLFSIQFNLSYQQLYPTDFQSLNLGSCIKNDGDLFCQMYRRNSFCSIQHDECFCLPGYVSIYEMNDSWYTCKPYLYCRIDSDCSYIHGSICHPGVGACVCPSGYEFVFQHFSCLPRVNDSSNPFCTACQRIDGVCVLNNRKNGLLLDKYHQNDLQCACPRKPNISVIKKYSFLDICNPIPVDIGEECNHINKVCLSQKAICLDSSINIRQTQSTTNRNVNICVCHEGMIPVYQKNLDYFECFIEETDPTIIDCQHCYQSNGKCYRFNIGSINRRQYQYSCSCSLFKQNDQSLSDYYYYPYYLDINSDKTKINIESDQYKQREQLSEFHIKRKDCIEYLLQITCNQESIHICFKNPYQTSMIRTNHRSRNIQVYLDASRIYPEFIQHEFNYSIDNQKCYLIKQNNHNHNEYCLLINFNQFNELRQCGIYEISYKYGSVFYGTLHAEITKNEVSLLRNVHIDFVCHINVSYLNGSNLSTSYFYDRSIIFKKRTGQLALSQKSPGINNFLPTKHIEKDTLQDEKTRNTNSSSISLSIINLTKNISQNQEMTLKISSTLSEFILIEYCLVKGQSIPSKVLPTYEHEKLLDLKCFNTNIHRIKQIIDIYNNNLIEYQCILFKRIIHHRTSNNNHSIWISQSFHLNNISLYNTVYSTCLIRVCQIEQLCTYAEFYSLNRTNKQYNDPYVQSKVYIPLIMLNNNNNYRNKSKLSHLFPPINFNNLIQFYFIQSTLQINQTNINIQLNDSIDVYFKHSTINVNRSLEYVWIKYILGISIFTLMCQIIIFSFKHLKKCYTKYKFVNHRNPFVMTAVTNEVQQSVNRDVNSKQICHNDLHVENKCELHNTNVIMNDNRLNKEIKDIKCDRIEHNSLDYQQQTSHSMTCLLIYPSNKSNKCRLLFNHNHNHNNNTRLHYTNSCLSSPIHCQYNQNHLSQFMIDSCVKSKNINLSQRISKSTLNIATNHQMKVSTEQLTLNEYDKMNQVNHKNHSLFNNYTHRNVFLPTCYHNDCLKQKYGYCTVYHSLKNQDYKDGWV